MELTTNEQLLYNEISEMIEQSRRSVAVHANGVSAQLFWRIGKRINDDVLQNERAEYGKRIVVSLSRQLVEHYGRSFEERNLRRMLQFADQFPDWEIVVSLSRQLSWGHVLALLPLKTPEAKMYYAQETVRGMLGVRGLRKMISRKAFERREIADNQLTSATAVPPGTFKDPYLLDILGLKDEFLENDLEDAILREIQNFILEFGKGFAFMERQKRMIIDGRDHYLDLLFFHRPLKRLVAVELKIGSFEASHKGQMELYLGWLDRYEKLEGEDAPIGLILCAETSREEIELLNLDRDGILVAEYWTDLPPKDVFEQKIRTLLLETQERMEQRKLLLPEAYEEIVDDV
jgi:predicted nuclease of restriction endonuclease-like (RecB) superfamily